MDSIHGLKTYLVAVAAVLYALSCYFLGFPNAMDLNAAMAFFTAGAGAAAIRHAIERKP